MIENLRNLNKLEFDFQKTKIDDDGLELLA